MDLLLNLLHGFVNIFAGGRSGAKVILFLVYLAVLYVIVRLRNKPGRRPQILPWTLALTGGLLLAGFLAQLVFFSLFGLSWSRFIYLSSHQEFTSTYSLHNHIFKGAIGWLLDWFNLGRQPNVDTGLAWIGFFPSWIYALVLSLTAVLLALFIRNFQRNHPLDMEGRSRWWFTLAYAVFSFSLLKNVFDGGLLNREVPISVAGLLLLYFPFRKIIQKISGLMIVGYVLLMALLWRAGAVTSEQFNYQSFNFVAHLFLLIVLLASLYLPKNWWRRIILIASSVGLVTILLYNLAPYHREAKLPVNRNSGALIGVLQDLSDNDLSLVERIGDLRIYRYDGEKSATLSELWRKLGLNSNLGPIAVPAVNCFAGASTKAQLVAISDNPPSATMPRHRFGRVLSVRPIHSNRWQGYEVILELSPCTPRNLDLVVGLLNELGFSRFLITDFLAADLYRPGAVDLSN